MRRVGILSGGDISLCWLQRTSGSVAHSSVLPIPGSRLGSSSSCGVCVTLLVKECLFQARLDLEGLKGRESSEGSYLAAI